VGWGGDGGAWRGGAVIYTYICMCSVNTGSGGVGRGGVGCGGGWVAGRGGVGVCYICMYMHTYICMYICMRVCMYVCT
jgi:hypothetical protein